MAIDDEREIRQRLGGALDAIVPSPAPVNAVLRKGRVMRSRRRITVAAGLAIVVLAAAAAIPGLLHQPRPQSPVTHRNRSSKVTVARLGGHVAPGLIARGTIGARAWRITYVRASDSTLCVVLARQAHCVSSPVSAPSGIASMGSFGSAPGWQSVYGPVRRDVSRIRVELSDGAILDLRPFASSGLRWIGLVIPGQLRVVDAIAYSGRRELGYSVPFTAKDGSISFVHWLRPDQAGPARQTRLIGSGVADGRAWSVVGHAGPWGYCDVLTSPANSSVVCSPVHGSGHGFAVDFTLGAAPDLPRWLIGTAPPSAAYLLLTFSDRSSVRVPVVDFGGAKSFAMAITTNPRIIRWAAYDASGRKLLGAQGSPEQWRPKR